MSQEETTRRHNITNEAFNLRHEAEARQFFRAVFDDEREAQQAATEFSKLSRALAVARPNSATPTQSAEQFYQRLVNQTATGQAPSREANAAAVRATLGEMREANRDARSSPQARRAHLEIDSYRPTDDLRALLETPDGRTRPEHANYLNQVNPEARDLYERGAVVAGDAVIIPRDANSAPAAAEQVRMGSLTHAVNAFTPLVGATPAREKAAEFVALGHDIAGRAADGNARLVVFREFYRQVQRDEKGRRLAPAEQAARLDVVIEEMRPLAAAMREQEWTREDAEIVALEDWERGLETRQRDTEHESAGRLTYRIGETLGQGSGDGRTGPERSETATQLEELLQTHGTNSVSYERLSFANQPPRVPENLTPAETARLRYEVVPYLDRQLENGVPPAALLTQLARRSANEASHERAAQVTALLTQHAPAANHEHAVTRAEEARALYTLQALSVPSSDEHMRQRGFTAIERAAALDTVGGRLAQDYRAQAGQLKAFAALEQERDNLARAAAEYRDQQRATLEFQSGLANLRAQETGGKQPALRRELAALLVSPEVEREQAANAQQINQMARTLSRIAGAEITTTAEARTALAPGLRRMRDTLYTLAAERATLPIARTTRPNERYPNPLYVALPAQPNLRLAVANANEYRVITNTAEKSGQTLQTYAGLHGPPLTAESPARAAELNFVRDYVQYRLTDETTRLRNTNRLFREFDARLTNARTPDELRQTVKDIRQENYARARDPERFAHADAEAPAYGLPPQRPLNGAEMKQLFLAEAPAHYSDEMRDIRRDASLTARDKQARIKGLAQGQLQPSPALNTLLTEFQRTQANHPQQTTRNIKAFLGDYLNPPTPERTRFSRHNLYELRQQLAPAERDYFYQVIDSTRQATLDAPTRQRELREVKEPTADGRVIPIPAKTTRAAQASQPAPVQAQDNLGAVLEERISVYLEEVVNARGGNALASSREGPEHAAQVSRIIKETFAQQGVAPAAYRLNDERIAAAANQLVGALPHALQQEYAKQIGGNRVEQTRAERGSLLPDSRATPDVRPRAGTVRAATQTALEPLLEKNQVGIKGEETKELTVPGPTPAWAQPPAPASPPRPQEIAAHNRSQPNDRYVLRR